MSISAHEPERSAAVSPLIKRHRTLLWLLGAVLSIYALLGFVLVPYLVQRHAPKYVQQQLHRQLKLGKVQFNPFTLTVQIGATQLSEVDGTAIAGFEHLLINAELSSLFTKRHSFKQIRLDAPTVHVIVNADGKLNLDFSDPNARVENTDGKRALPAVRIGELQLTHGMLHLEDRARPQPFSTELKPIEFTLTEFRTEPNFDSTFHFAATSEAGETFDWRGDLTVQPLGSKGQFNIASLQASTLQSYLQDALPFRLLAGSVALQGNYELAASDALELKFDLPKIEVEAAQVAPKQGDPTAWVSLSTMQLAGTHVSLQQRSVGIDKIRIDGLQLNAWLDQNRNLNLLELLGPDEPSDAPWTSAVKEIELVNARAQIEDRAITPATQFTVFPMLLQVHNFSTVAGTIITLNTRLIINDHADVDATGTVDLDSLSSQLKVKLGNFSVADMQNYAAQNTDVIISEGRLNAEGDVYYKGAARNKNPEMKFTGNVEITNLSTQDKLEDKDFIKWQSLQLNNLSYSMAPDSLEIAQIVARKPYGRVIIASDGSTNIQHVLRIQPVVKKADGDAKPAVTTAAAAPSMRTRVGKVIIDNGAADFADYSVQPSFATGMERLSGTVTNLSSANDSRAKVTLAGSVDNYAPVSITGEANFLAADTFSDIALKFSNMELTTFNPYSGKFAGYSIAKGKLNTELRYQIQNRKLDAQHHIVIDQLEFGAATDSKDAVPLPIKLAVSLLKDRHGVIDLNLPVTGSLDDPQFKVGPIVWKAFVGLLSKIVTAPFSALGSLFGGGEELAYVDFTPGTASLNTVEVSKLTTLSKAMVERPQLKLNIPLTAVNDTDAAALNDAAFTQGLNTVLPNMATASEAQRLTALATLYRNKLGSAPVYPATSEPSADVTISRIAWLEAQLKPLFAISAADRDALTRARADAVQAALLANAELSAERIFLTARSNEVESPAGVVRMELKLE